MKILIVDYSISMAERLEEMLSATANITSIHKAASFTDAIDCYRAFNHDIVLLDICLPFNNSFKILKEIKIPGSKTYAIILAMEKGTYVNEKCNALGVDFFFDKYSEFQKIPTAIDYIMRTAD